MEHTNYDPKLTVTMKRTFNAPLALVWQAWTQAEHIVNWWSPKGMQTEILAHEFTVGGKWKYKMPMPNGMDFIAEGEYLEIVEHEKIVSKADFKPMTEGVEMHALFEADGDKTKFTFHVVHPTEEYKIQQEQMGILNGWGGVFDRLEGLLSSL